MNILIKLMSIVSLVIAPFIGGGHATTAAHGTTEIEFTETDYSYTQAGNMVIIKIGENNLTSEAHAFEFRGGADGFVNNVNIVFASEGLSDLLDPAINKAAFKGTTLEAISPNRFHGSGEIVSNNNTYPAKVMVVLLDDKSFKAELEML